MNVELLKTTFCSNAVNYDKQIERWIFKIIEGIKAFSVVMLKTLASELELGMIEQLSY